ncbi:MAG: chorismate synthase [Anaerovoracaceae bacterium]|jgi:chorismate synthase
MQSSFGKNIRITIDGGSHEEEIGVTIEGLPPDLEIDMDKLQAFLDRRAPGRSPFTTARKEADVPVKVSDKPLRFVIRNTDVRSSDYRTVNRIPRPGHADYTAYLKYGDTINMAGGGPFSARMTAPLCIAGGIALQRLERRGVAVCSHIFSITDVYDEPFDPMMEEPPQIEDPSFPVLSPPAGEAMKEEIIAARDDLDSVGGVVETAVIGLSGGYGGPMFDGVESRLAPILFGIPAVKGVEFGAGFASAYLRGSENNDPFIISNGRVITASNCHGGILGGITSGMPIITRVAFKPTPSIGQPQQSVDLETMKPATLNIKGRHDPCVVVRAVPVVEAAIAIGLLDLTMEEDK